MFHGGFDRSRPPAEMAPEALTEAKEPLTHPRQLTHLAVGCRFLIPSRALLFMFHLAVPGLLIKLALSLLIHENQSDKSDGFSPPEKGLSF